MTNPPVSRGNLGSAIGFLLLTFAVVGLAGVFATYAIPIPQERAFLFDKVLDQALLAPTPEALAELRAPLGDAAAKVLDGSGPLPERVTQARQAMHAELKAEAEEIALRSRWIIVVITIMGAGFGAALCGARMRRN